MPPSWRPGNCEQSLRTPQDARLEISVTANGSTVLDTGTDGGPGAEFVGQALDLGAKVYATARTLLTIHRKEAIMPLVYVTVAEGTTSQDQRARIGDAIYRALIDVTNAPEDDRFQVINEVSAANLIYSVDFRGFDRSPSVMFIQIFFNAARFDAGRSVDVKRALYARIAENLRAVGVRGDDIFINLVEMPPENWSFGRGELSYPPAAQAISRS